MITLVKKSGPRDVAVICQYRWKDPASQEVYLSSCLVRTTTTKELQRRFEARMRTEGREGAVMLSYLTENGRQSF